MSRVEAFPLATLDDVCRAVEEHWEETAAIEFKRALPESGKNDDLAVDICAMANTQGGIIIYGVGEDKAGRASELCPFSLRRDPERVEQVAHQIDGPVDVIATLIRARPGDGVGFLTVRVPSSTRTPHFHKGIAWGRTSKGNYRLTRRQVGELFAKSDGFVQEFGVQLQEPGRIVVEPIVEKPVLDGTHVTYFYYLILHNVGGRPLTNVDLRLIDTPWVRILTNPCPIAEMPAGSKVRLRFLPTDRLMGRVVVAWTDERQERHEQVWPVTWWLT